jgi:hypothetical protein
VRRRGGEKSVIGLHEVRPSGLVTDEYLGNRCSHGAQSRIGGGNCAISRQDGKNLRGRFGLGIQSDTGLAAPGQRGERTSLPVDHCNGVVLVEASELERLTIEFF